MKTTRQRAILSLVASRPIRSKEELAQLLEAQGYDAAPATVSRDVKELGLIKVPLESGDGATQFKYVEPAGAPAFVGRLHRLIAELVLDVKGSLSQIVLRTQPGSAMMVASGIDSAEWDEIIGTIGGDDTVLVVLDDPAHMPVVRQRFLDMRAENGII
jgi:transcriptional regulator of arginine metabolism